MGSDSDMLTVLVNDPDPNAWYRAQGLGSVTAATIDGRCPNNDSLLPPLAAVVIVAPKKGSPWHGGKV